MATSSKDIETLWNCYSNEVNKQCISVAQFFESNGIPYHVFEKWYKRRYRQPDVVECQVEDDSAPAPSSSAQQVAPVVPASPSASLTVSHITLCLSNGMRIDHHKLGFEELLSFIKKLEPLCFA